MAQATARRNSPPPPTTLADSVLGMIDPEVLQTFTEEQRREIEGALEGDPQRDQHLVRVQTKLPLLPVYVYLAMGRERRSHQVRISQEHRRPRRWLATLGFQFTVFAGLLALAFAALLMIDLLVEDDLLAQLGIRDGIHWLNARLR